MIEVQPLKDRILVSPLAEERTKSGIILPDTAVVQMNRGRVLARGASVTLLEIGDEVVYTRYSGTPVEIREEKMQILSEDDVVAIIRETPNEDIANVE